MDPALRVEVSQIEALWQDKGDKEIDDSDGVMFKAMIQSPMGGEGVEEVIFNIPSTMACFPKLTAGELRKKEGGLPPPVMFFNVSEPFFGDASSPITASKKRP